MPYERHVLLCHLNEEECEIQRALAFLRKSQPTERALLKVRLSTLQQINEFVKSMDIKDDYHILWKKYYTGWRP